MRRLFLAPAFILSLSAAMLAPASAQVIPSGSYQQSCQNVRMRGDMLVARCNGPQGLVGTSIDPRSCRGGDIVNRDGQLACNRAYRNGQRYGNNGYGNNGYGTNGN